MEIDLDGGTRRFPDAGREDVPEIVARLVAEGERVYGVRVVRGTLEDAYLEAVEGSMTADLRTIAGYALREALRRRVLTVVVVLTVAFLALFWLGVREAFEESQSLSAVPDLEEQTLVGATLVGLAMFVTLFLGTVLAVFLTLSAVRGDAERGLLQPIVVRPIGRTTLLVARFAAASAVCVVYVELVFASAVVITGATGRLVAEQPRARRPGAGRGGRRGRRDLAPGLDGPLHDGQRHRRLHGLRRRPRGRAAGAGRRGAELGHAARHRVDRVLGAAVRGALPVGAAHADGGHLRA